MITISPAQSQAFSAMRKMYCRIWARCHAINSSMGRRPALPGLAAAFESILEQVAPEAARHCARLGFDPLKAALPWMLRGFVGVLEMDQLLLLWDRVIGYDSLLPLAVVAAGVFLFMQKSLLVRERGGNYTHCPGISRLPRASCENHSNIRPCVVYGYFGPSWG